MAEEPRRSTRERRIRRDSSYYYDEKVFSALSNTNNTISDNRQLRDQCESNSVNLNTNLIDSNKVEEASGYAADTWIKLLYSSNQFVNSEDISGNEDQHEVFSEDEVGHSVSVGDRGEVAPNPHSASINVSVHNINSAGAAERRNSSTNIEFLDIEGNFLSAGTMSGGRSSSEGENVERRLLSGTKLGNIASFSGRKPDSPESPGVGEINTAILTVVNNLSAQLANMDTRLQQMEDRVSGRDSVSDASARASSRDGRQKHRQSVEISSKSKSKVKKDRVEFEKQRSSKVLLDKIKSRNQKTDSDEEASDEDHDLPTMRKKLSRRQREAARKRSSVIQKKAGSTFPVSEEESTSSGMDSGSDSQSRKKGKVKSGAKVRSRPVVKTELWPHTIAIEDDGDDFTSENISLAKFLSCFTYIMTSCEDIEASGRTWLLHAMSHILELLP